MKTKDLRIEREAHRQHELKMSILKAAEAVIVRKGYSSFTMDDVAQEAQVSKATLYRYFKGKGELIFEIIGNYFDELEKKLAEIRSLRKSACGRLWDTIHCVLRFHEEKQNISRVFMMDEAFMKKLRIFIAGPEGVAKDADRKFIDSLRAKRKRLVDGTVEMLSEGIKAREFRRMDVAQAVIFLEAALQGYMHGRFWSEKRQGLKEAADLIHSFFLDGIKNKKR